MAFAIVAIALAVFLSPVTSGAAPDEPGTTENPPPAPVPTEPLPEAVTTPRPTPHSGGETWTTGPYAYDGAGNIVHIGPHTDQRTDYYVYDAVHRLVTGNAHTETYRNEQNIEYDPFGNITTIVETITPNGGTPQTGTTPIDVEPGTNRLTDMPGCLGQPNCVRYDAAGNLLSGPAYVTYAWDALGMMTRRENQIAGQTVRYIYDANNERIVISTLTGTTDLRRYTLRDPSNKVVREAVDTVTHDQHDWSWSKDYVYRSGQLLSAVASASGGSQSRTHFHLDHLGTPRMITDDSGRRLAMHTYWPLGAEAPGSSYDEERMKFTGHERDLGMASGPNLDYMHARFYTSALGRFLSVDRAGNDRLAEPQAWNRYAYALDNPINRADPDGLKDYWLQSFSREHRTSTGSIRTTPNPGERNPLPQFYASTSDITGVLSKTGPSDNVVIQAHSGASQMGLYGAYSSQGSIDAPTMIGALNTDKVRPASLILAGCNSQVVGKEVAKATGVPVAATVGGIGMRVGKEAVQVMLNVLKTGSLEQAVAAANKYLKDHPVDCGKDDCKGHFAVFRKTMQDQQLDPNHK